jgi:hypothetical protein
MNTFNEPIEVSVRYPEHPLNQQTEIDLGEVKKEPAKTEPKAEVKAEPVPADEGIDVLRRQLEEKRREADEAKRQRHEAERLAQEREQQLMSVRSEAQSSQHTALVNAIASYERDGEMLENRYATLLESGDYREAAKVQRQMAQVEAKLTTLQQGREELEYRLQNPPQPQPQIQQQPPRDSIDDKISHLTQRSQDWIRSHPEVLSDPKLNNMMTAGHYEAVANGYQVDTPEYFSHIESKLGYGQQSAPEINRQEAVSPNKSQGRVPIASAPVSRSPQDTIQRQGNSMTVTLTPEMRATAAELDMSEEEYAQNLAFYINRGDIRR